MKYDAYGCLLDLSQKCGKEYGKLVQKLLAIAFCEAGATCLTERGIQGIDLEMVLADGRRLALEVKTAQEETVTFGKKDIDGLAARQDGGYLTYFAVLGSRLLDDWIFARYWPDEILAQRDYSLIELCAYRDMDLTNYIREHFAAAVSRHCAAAIEGGQGVLDAVLREYPCYKRA
jgi:hypothetical protein